LWNSGAFGMAWNGSKNIVNRRSRRGVLQFSIVVVSPARLHVSYDRLDTFMCKHTATYCYVTVTCTSVRLSRRPTAAAACGWFVAEPRPIKRLCGRRVPSINQYRLRSAANAGSVMLRVEGRGSTQTGF